MALTSVVMNALDNTMASKATSTAGSGFAAVAYQENIGMVLHVPHTVHLFSDCPERYVRIMLWNFSSAFNTIFNTIQCY